MLDFNYYLPTKVVHGEHVVEDHGEELAGFGARALVVTGSSSGRLSGALDDVIAVFDRFGTVYEVFDAVENNPSLANVGAAGEQARAFQPDFIVGIGGGSPLDAAKAIAVLAVNDIPPMDLYTGEYEKKPLPIAAIPTTAGTGSEVTPYSILTIPEKETKQGFGCPDLFPKVAYLDYRYTMSLPPSITVDTGVDALSHLMEGYLSRRAVTASDMFAEQGMKLWSACSAHLADDTMSPQVRDHLLVASALGGMTISHTGTTFVHALGYPLTYFHHIPHGQANGLVMGEYLRYTEGTAPERVRNVLDWLNLPDVDSFAALMNSYFGRGFTLSQEDIKRYAYGASQTKNARYSLGQVTEDVLTEVLEKSLG